MKIVEINGGVFGSTGRIMFGIADALTAAGHEVLCFSPVTATNHDSEPDHDYVKIGSFRTRQLDVLAERITGLHGCFAYFATKALIRKIEAFSPDVIHLHTLHGGFVNLPMLFRYIRARKVKVVWTLHDCWSFTGHCPHFESAGCEKWKTGCHHCPIYREYPKSLLDTSDKLYSLKKKWFLGIEDMTLITPSVWLKQKVEESFLSCYPVKVIHNGIDLSVFRPSPSDFKKRFACEDKYIVLGVAFGWGEKKGLDVFLRLAKELSQKYQIVLVGTDEATDSLLPCDVISIHRTQNTDELVQLYSAADVFVIPTREDTFPTVNIEALACGTPVLTFRTGGSPEIIDESCGCVVEKDDFEGLYQQIERICQQAPYSKSECRLRASAFDRNMKFNEYVSVLGLV